MRRIMWKEYLSIEMRWDTCHLYIHMDKRNYEKKKKKISI